MTTTLKEAMDWNLIRPIELRLLNVEEQDTIIAIRDYQNPVRYDPMTK